ncbi:MAG TPA: ABC transporter ATP-binding protein [Candidatus Anaerobutyricum stercoripullorum]|uniref:ABC transporter ATP-binding protein n=1 Tax=Candidatus Anaerobutyricum stercoripullorum TaxID=2838456 RepID=A0A9D1X5V5_9FIRM|nr:ABC transporter ATP-binding protein [Candidatus Anaerobutyricum stercoripullorum]
MEILRVEHVSKIYGEGETEVRALDDVSFSMEKGELAAVVGRSGSGKSTLLHILGGVDRPSDGKVLVEGQEVHGRSPKEMAIFRRRKVGLVYQFYNLIPVLNVVENITLPLRLDGQRVNEEHLLKMLEMLGLSDRKKHLPRQLSGGQQQRVSIGRALIHAPALLLCDEPTGNLDQANSQAIMELIKASNRRYRQTTLIVTHDEDIALQTDRIIRMADGRILSDEKIR